MTHSKTQRGFHHHEYIWCQVQDKRSHMGDFLQTFNVYWQVKTSQIKYASVGSSLSSGSRWHLLPRIITEFHLQPIPNISNITRYVHCWPPRPHGQPPILQHKDPQRAPRLSTRFTDHSCLHRHDRVALFIHRWGWGHTSDPSPCITLPPNRTAGCLKLSTRNTWTDCQHMCVCLVQGRSFSFLDWI